MSIQRWFFIPLIILVNCIAIFPTSQAQENLPAIFKKIGPSVVVIVTYDKDGNTIGQGSGFFVSKDGVIVTNRHVLKGVNSAEIKTADGNVYPINEVVAEDKDHDLIQVRAMNNELALKFKQNTVRPLSISTSYPEVGEKIIVIGSPLGLEQTVSDGIVSAIRKIPEFGNIIQITASISPGSSGSPVVNMKGEVIGVATFQFIQGQNLNFAISAEKIVRLKRTKGEPLEDYWASAQELFEKGHSFIYPAKDYDRALTYFKKAAQKDPRLLPYPMHSIYFYIGEVSYNLGRFQEAIEAFTESIRIEYSGITNDSISDTYNKLGDSFLRLDRYNEAIAAYQDAIRIYPQSGHAHFGLGIAYSELEDIDSWNKEYETLRDLNLVFLAQVLFKVANGIPLQEGPESQDKPGTLSERFLLWPDVESIIPHISRNNGSLIAPIHKEYLKEEPQAEKKEGMTDWWKKNKEHLESDGITYAFVEPTEDIDLGLPPIYFDSIKNKIKMYWFPTSDDFTVALAFTIKSNGEIEDVMVEKSSGSISFDKEAIRTVMKANPFPPFPEWSKEKELKVHFKFTREK